MDYHLLAEQAEAMIAAEPWYVSALSNLSALLMQTLPSLNWAGFYLLRDRHLTLGPFQGKPACVHIEWGRGVCGAAVARNEIQLVPDVHAFPGHIACDSASASELVIPLRRDGKVFGVLDLDSPLKNRFTSADAEGLRAVAEILERRLLL